MFNGDKIRVKTNGEVSTIDEVKFTIKCNVCGNEHVRLIDKHVYDKTDYKTIEFYCQDCHNKFEFLI